MKLLCSLILLGLSFNLCAGDVEKLHLTGKTIQLDLHSLSESVAKYVSYRVYHEDSLIDAGSSSYRGHFNLDLDFGKEYIVVFMEERFVTKKISLNLMDASKLVLDKGFKFRMDVTLFEADDHTAYAFLEETPYVNAYLDGSNMEVDNGHMKYMQGRIEEVFQLMNNVTDAE